MFSLVVLNGSCLPCGDSFALVCSRTSFSLFIVNKLCDSWTVLCFLEFFFFCSAYVTMFHTNIQSQKTQVWGWINRPYTGHPGEGLEIQLIVTVHRSLIQGICSHGAFLNRQCGLSAQRYANTRTGARTGNPPVARPAPVHCATALRCVQYFGVPFFQLIMIYEFLKLLTDKRKKIYKIWNIGICPSELFSL